MGLEKLYGYLECTKCGKTEVVEVKQEEVREGITRLTYVSTCCNYGCVYEVSDVLANGGFVYKHLENGRIMFATTKERAVEIYFKNKEREKENEKFRKEMSNRSLEKSSLRVVFSKGMRFGTIFGFICIIMPRIISFICEYTNAEWYVYLCILIAYILISFKVYMKLIDKFSDKAVQEHLDSMKRFR